MMPKVKQVTAMPDLCLRVEFDDGVTGEVDLSGAICGPVFEPLRDPAEFAKVFVDEFGAVAWPCGADLAPDALHEELSAKVHT